MELQIDLIIADLEKYTRSEIIALGLNMNANLRDSPPIGTPIDTGWASANWMPSVGQPKILDSTPADPKEGPTPGEVAARARLANEGLSDILAWRQEDGPIFSTNSVDYIQPLNSGHSPQSPKGFVQAALERAVRQTQARARSTARRTDRAAAFRNRRRRAL